MTRTETQLRETVIAVHAELYAMRDRNGTEFQDGVEVLRILLDAVDRRNRGNPNLSHSMVMDVASRRKPYDFARWLRKQE